MQKLYTRFVLMQSRTFTLDKCSKGFSYAALGASLVVTGTVSHSTYVLPYMAYIMAVYCKSWLLSEP